MRIDAGKRPAAITPYEYGLFIGPIGGLMKRYGEHFGAGTIPIAVSGTA